MYPRVSVIACLVIFLTLALVTCAPASEPASPRVHLGITVSPSEEGKPGIVVKDVTPDGPAARSGLKEGDRIVKLENEVVRNVDSFLQAIAAKKPGDKLTLGIEREGSEQSLTVALAERPARDNFPLQELLGLGRPAFLGVQTQALTSELKDRLKVATETGAVITEVVPNSPAAKAGLKRDDVITAVEGQAVKTPEELRAAVQKAGPGKEIVLQLERGNEKLSVNATLRRGAFGLFLTPGEDHFPTLDVQSMFDQGQRLRQLERRMEELDKRFRELEKK